MSDVFTHMIGRKREEVFNLGHIAKRYTNRLSVYVNWGFLRIIHREIYRYGIKTQGFMVPAQLETRDEAELKIVKSAISAMN